MNYGKFLYLFGGLLQMIMFGIALASVLPQDLVLLRHLGMIVSRLLDVDWESKNMQPRNAGNGDPNPLTVWFLCCRIDKKNATESPMMYLLISHDFLWFPLPIQVFQFFPDLPLIDFCIFNASGWDRVKERLRQCSVPKPRPSRRLIGK